MDYRKDKKITVFTPAYNRAHTLIRTYESLLRQTSNEFVWLIIDDGSTDNTKELVQSWLEEKKIEIVYMYQENQGMHGAHNKAYANIDTELNICIDSDDYLSDKAIEIIIKKWAEVDDESIVGIIGLDAHFDGRIIGDYIPKDIQRVKLFDLNYKYKVKGDKKLVYRTSSTNKYEYPIFYGEKYVGLAYKYYKLDLVYDLLPINEVLCYVEYQIDGSTNNMMNQYLNNPEGFRFYRKENLKNPLGSWLYKFKERVHLISSNYILNDKDKLNCIDNRFLGLITLPLGFALYNYIKIKVRKKNVSI